QALLAVDAAEPGRPGRGAAGAHLDDGDHRALPRDHIQLQVADPQVGGDDVPPARGEILDHGRFGPRSELTATGLAHVPAPSAFIRSQSRGPSESRLLLGDGCGGPPRDVRCSAARRPWLRERQLRIEAFVAAVAEHAFAAAEHARRPRLHPRAGHRVVLDAVGPGELLVAQPQIIHEPGAAVAARALAVTRSVVRVALRVGAAARAIHGLVGPAVGQLRRYGLLDDLVRARNAAKLPIRRVRREAILRLDLPVRAAHPALEAVDDT